AILPQDVQAQPSEFARAMLGYSIDAEDSPAPTRLFSMPYADITEINELNAFAGPSPDDVVTSAQSKGSIIFGMSKIRSNTLIGMKAAKPVTKKPNSSTEIANG